MPVIRAPLDELRDISRDPIYEPDLGVEPDSPSAWDARISVYSGDFASRQVVRCYDLCHFYNKD
jgi:hypothetical protein